MNDSYEPPKNFHLFVHMNHSYVPPKIYLFLNILLLFGKIIHRNDMYYDSVISIVNKNYITHMQIILNKV